jgi:hypothetical protein
MSNYFLRPQPIVVQPTRVQLMVVQPIIVQPLILQLKVVCIFATLKIYFLYHTIAITKARFLPHLSSKVVLSKNNKRTKNENNKRKYKVFRFTNSRTKI